MDTKALAKSKRAHSLHHTKKHQFHQASKSKTQAQISRLPSNWAQYEGLEEDQAISGQRPEFVVPKSKGADYLQLITDAKAQAPSNYSSQVSPSNYSSEDFCLFDDVMYDFPQDFGPMLAAKGQQILSWVADDIFEFEGKESTNFEAPFLSLNMNALAAQLAKVKLSKRVFVEPDLLPAKLLDDDLQTHVEDKDGPQTCTSSAETDSSASSLGFNKEVSASSTTGEGFKPIKQTKDEKKTQSQGTNISISSKSQIADSSAVSPPIFEAESAEEELDMLLSSFNGIKVVESMSASSSIAAPASGSGGKVTKRTQMMQTDIDEAIDNLLDETSNPSLGLKASSTTMCTSSKSKAVDDFDSWWDTI